jgi:hypothetical protein
MLFGIEFPEALQGHSVAAVVAVVGYGKYGPQEALGRQLGQNVRPV